MKINDNVFLVCKELEDGNYKYMYRKGEEDLVVIGMSSLKPQWLTIQSPVGKRIIELMKTNYNVTVDDCEVIIDLEDYDTVLHDKFDKVKMELQEEVVPFRKEDYHVKNPVELKDVPRNSDKYRKFKKKVKQRDCKCVCCGYTKDLEVHHILPYSKYRETQTAPENGVTLCHECHSKYESLFKDNICGSSLIEFIKKRTQLDEVDSK